MVAMGVITILGLCGLSELTPPQSHLSGKDLQTQPEGMQDSGAEKKVHSRHLPASLQPHSLNLSPCQCRDPSHLCLLTSRVTYSLEDEGGVRPQSLAVTLTSNCLLSAPPTLLPVTWPLRCPFSLPPALLPGSSLPPLTPPDSPGAKAWTHLCLLPWPGQHCYPPSISR